MGQAIRCNATSKTTGKQCRQYAIAGRTKCHYHGGKTPVGMALPQTKHGRYSKHLPARLAERYEEALNDTDLLALNHEIAITDAQIAELLGRIEEASPDDPEALDAWLTEQRKIRGDVQLLIESRRRLVDTERKRLVDMQQMMTVTEALLLLAAVEDVVRRHVTDRDMLADIARDFAVLINRQ